MSVPKGRAIFNLLPNETVTVQAGRSTFQRAPTSIWPINMTFRRSVIYATAQPVHSNRGGGNADLRSFVRKTAYRRSSFLAALPVSARAALVTKDAASQRFVVPMSMRVLTQVSKSNPRRGTQCEFCFSRAPGRASLGGQFRGRPISCSRRLSFSPMIACSTFFDGRAPV